MHSTRIQMGIWRVGKNEKKNFFQTFFIQSRCNCGFWFYQMFSKDFLLKKFNT